MLLNNLKDVLTDGEVAIVSTSTGTILEVCPNGLRVDGLSAWLEVNKVVAVENHKIMVLVK